MNWLRLFLLSTFGAMAAVGAAAAEKSLTQATVKKDKDQTVISFKVPAATDVEVAVLNGAGAVVRHLAAGVLGGKNAPPEPLKKGLSQAIPWDGKDDFGNTAKQGPFKVRIRTGLGATFDSFIGQDPYNFGAIESMVSDLEGNLYAMNGPVGQNVHTLRVFKPDGSYARTLMPFPSDLPPNALPGIARWDEQAKCFFAVNNLSLNPMFYPWGGEVARVVSASAKAGVVVVSGGTIFQFEPSGAVKAPGRPMWSANAKLSCPAWLQIQVAASPDGKYLYYSNVAGTAYDGKSPADIDPRWPQGRVYRQEAAKDQDPQPFYDLVLPDFAKTPYWMPSAWDKKSAAAGLAVDAAGHVYVGDLVNQEVVEIGTDGKKISASKVPWPDSLIVDSKSGTLYVSSLPVSREGKPPAKILKVSGRGDKAKVVAEYQLKQGGAPSMAFGTIKGKAVIWVAAGNALICLGDEGGSLAEIKTNFAPRPGSEAAYNRIAVDYERDEVYANDSGAGTWRYNGSTGEGGVLTNKKGEFFPLVDLSVGYDGLIYARTGGGYSGPFERLTHELEPAPFKESGTHVLSGYIYSRMGVGIGYSEHGIGVGPQGQSYLSFMYGWNKYCVSGFGADGKAIKGNYLKGKVGGEDAYKAGMPRDLDSAVVGPLPLSNGGIRVDFKGDLYVGMRLRATDHAIPKGFENDPAYATWTGSIVKFSPDGGTVSNTGSGDDVAPAASAIATVQNSAISGAKQIYSGIGGFSGGGFGTYSDCCVCRVPRFDLDRYGRIAYANVVTSTVTIIDNAGNTVTTFGSYGNFDSQYVPPGAKDKQPLVKTSAIPLAWPTGVGFSKEHLYVLDTANRRVVRTKLTWSSEETVEIK